MAQPKAFSYVRFSSKKQALGDSLRRQVENSRQYAEQQGLALDESFRDPGKAPSAESTLEAEHWEGFLRWSRQDRSPTARS